MADVYAEPAAALAAARRIAASYGFGVKARFEASTPVQLSPVVVRGDAVHAMVYMREAQGFCALTFDSRRRVTELQLATFKTSTHQQTDDFYFSRLALCRAHQALERDAPPVSHPLVSTQLMLREGSFPRLALAPGLAAGFERYLLAVTVGPKHGAEFATGVSADAQPEEFVLSVTDEAALRAITEQLGDDVRCVVRWEGRSPCGGDATLTSLELRLAAGGPELIASVDYSRVVPDDVAAELTRRATRPVLLT